jgi:hypothetical protein
MKNVTQNIKLLTDNQGYPVLPSWEAINSKGHKYKQCLIGKFMSDMYRERTTVSCSQLCHLIQFSEVTVGGGKERVPWAKLQEAQGNFILSKYLPNGVTLTQFHHIRVDDANTLLKHWTQRQSAGEIPLRFMKSDKADRHGKRASADEDVYTGVGQKDQSEGGLPNAHEDQERGDVEEDRGDGEGSANEGPDGQGEGDATRNQSNINQGLTPVYGRCLMLL